MDNLELKNRIISLISNLNDGLFERKDAIKMCLLAALAGESVFMLGPPGIAKSMIARRLSQAFCEVESFEYLMTRFSTPEEVFGPLSITELKDNGKYLRLTNGYLPKAQVVFLDEIWKAGPAILNTLLTVINEHVFRNGGKEEKIPMHLLISASNELPEINSGLEALYDRMLIRLWLDPISSKDSFKQMLTAQLEPSEIPDKLKISENEYNDWQAKIKEVSINSEVFDDLFNLKEQFQMIAEKQENKESTQSLEAKQQLRTLGSNATLYISDRRWKKAYHLLCTAAFFNGRHNVEKIDLLLLKDCLWHNLHARSHVNRIIENYASTKLYKQEESQILLQQLQMDLNRLSGEILKDIGIKMTPKSSTLLKSQNNFTLDFSGNEIDIKRTKQTIVFLDECHLNPDNIDSVTTSAKVDTAELKKWLRKGTPIHITLPDQSIVELPLAVDSSLNLVARGLSGKIIALTLAKVGGFPQWQRKKWETKINEYTNRIDDIQKKLATMQNTIKAQASHVFLSQNIMLIILESFNNLVSLEKEVSNRIRDLKIELKSLELELES